MKTKLYIPSIINVGYQERENTYTGKLAYIVYTDEKGVIRKETSWKGWCKHFLGEFKNTPTSGFVLNKGVGGQRESYGWNTRNEYIRVYDPRGWEFEISVANLLFILQECTSTKGKGLEGEFVYSWDGKELVLIPTSCEDYKECLTFTENKSKKVSKADVRVGNWCTFKDGEKKIYLGRHKCKDGMFDKFEFKHVYLDPERKYCPYSYEKGFTKIAVVGDQDENFAQYVEDFVTGEHCVEIVGIRWEDVQNCKLEDIPYNSKYIRDGERVLYVYPVERSYYWGDNCLDIKSCNDVSNLQSYLEKKRRWGSYDKVKSLNPNTFTIVRPVLILANGKEFYPEKP